LLPLHHDIFYYGHGMTLGQHERIKTRIHGFDQCSDENQGNVWEDHEERRQSGVWWYYKFSNCTHTYRRRRKTNGYEIGGRGISMWLGARTKHPLIAAIDRNYEMFISRPQVEKDNWGQQKEIMTDGRLYGNGICRQKYETRKYPHLLGQWDVLFLKLPGSSESIEA
jgi:hypothetical protein